jgi:transposase
MDVKAKETPAAAELNWRNKSRRTYAPEQRLAMVRECDAPGVSVAAVAQRNRVNTNLLFKWKRQHERGQLPGPRPSSALVPVTVLRGRKRRVKRTARAQAKAATPAGAIEVELPGARVFLHGAVSEVNLAIVLRALARR